MAKRLFILHHCQVSRRPLWHNQQGMTLIEVLLVVGLVSILGLANVFFVTDFMKRINKIQTESEEQSESAVISSTALNIIKRSNLSFNQIVLPDDNGNNFFDYFPDIPSSELGTAGNRIFSISATNREKYFYLFASSEVKANSLVLDPVHVYSATPQPADYSQDGSVTYKGLNSIPHIKDGMGNNTNKKLMSQFFGEVWKNGQIFLVTCPTYLRPIQNGTVDLSTPPHMPSLVGRAESDDLIVLGKDKSVVELYNSHPLTESKYLSLDQFFRTLPTVGGAAPFVKIEPVDLVRFRMKENKSYPAGYADLVLDEWIDGAYQEKMLVAIKVKNIQFLRKSAAIPIVNMEIER